MKLGKYVCMYCTVKVAYPQNIYPKITSREIQQTRKNIVLGYKVAIQYVTLTSQLNVKKIQFLEIKHFVDTFIE